MRLNVRRSPIVILILFFLALATSSSLGQQGRMDLATLFEGIELRPAESAFIAPPREILRPLLRCKKLIAQGKTADAVEILGEVLADESIEDFLIPRGTSSFGSLRSRTESILGFIDAKFLEPYEIRYGIRSVVFIQFQNDISLSRLQTNSR